MNNDNQKVEVSFYEVVEAERDLNNDEVKEGIFTNKELKEYKERTEKRIIVERDGEIYNIIFNNNYASILKKIIPGNSPQKHMSLEELMKIKKEELTVRSAYRLRKAGLLKD